MFSTEIWPFLPKVNSPDSSELTLIQSMGTVGIVCGMQMEMIAFRRFIEYRKGISAGYVGQSKKLPQIIPTIAEEDFNSIKETSSLRRRQFFFNRPIMACTQNWVHNWRLQQGVRCCFIGGLNQSLLSSVAQASALGRLQIP